MEQLKKLKKKYPDISNNIKTLPIKNEVILNNYNDKISIIKNKYDTMNLLLKNNINKYNKKIENISKEIKDTKNLSLEKEKFIKKISNHEYKHNYNRFLILKNMLIEKEKDLEKEKTILNKLNKDIDKYFIDLKDKEKKLNDNNIFFFAEK